MKAAILVIALTLAGCQTLPEQKEPVPIAVPCKSEVPPKPSYRYSPPYDSLFEAVRDLKGDRELSLGYETKLEAALNACK